MGIDPDLKGAITIYNPKSGILEHIYDMPLTPYSKRKYKKVLDKAAIMLIFEMHKDELALAVIEKIGVMPGDGRVGAFTFGYHYGLLEMGLYFAGIKTLKAIPSVWKASLGLSSDKDESRRKAASIFKTKSVYFMRKKDHGRAEAALLCLVGVPVVFHEQLRVEWHLPLYIKVSMCSWRLCGCVFPYNVTGLNSFKRSFNSSITTR